MAKTKKEAGTEDNPTATQEAATRPVEAEEKGGTESGADAERPKDTGMDQVGEAKAAGGKGLSGGEKAFLKEIKKSAKKVFAGSGVRRLFFTADGMGFGNKNDAADHAAALENQSIFIVDSCEWLS